MAIKKIETEEVETTKHKKILYQCDLCDFSTPYEKIAFAHQEEEDEKARNNLILEKKDLGCKIIYKFVNSEMAKKWAQLSHIEVEDWWGESSAWYILDKKMVREDNEGWSNSLVEDEFLVSIEYYQKGLEQNIERENKILNNINQFLKSLN